MPNACAARGTSSSRRATVARPRTGPAHSPGLLLLDIWMPILNGLEVLEHLGRSSEAVGLKIIVLSNLSDADTRLEGFALGVEDYWTKDLSLAELCLRIQRLLELSPIPPGQAV